MERWGGFSKWGSRKGSRKDPRASKGYKQILGVPLQNSVGIGFRDGSGLISSRTFMFRILMLKALHTNSLDTLPYNSRAIEFFGGTECWEITITGCGGGGGGRI